MSRYLVTGGAGFIGSHIVERLLKEGHFVRVLDNFSSGKEENLNFVIARSAEGRSSPVIARSAECEASPKGEGATKQSQNFELLRGDIREFSTCDQACAGIDYVLHQAALRSVPKSLENPYEYNEVNINGTLFMLQAALKNKVKRFIFASSSSIYGEADTFPQKEEHIPKLISPYALTKLAGEYYCRIFSQNFGLETVSLRYFNVFGPRQALDDEYAVVIPKFITCILNNEQPPIFGNGRQSRDFTYIDNVVETNILAATRHCEDADPERSEGEADEAIPKTFCEVFNVANGSDNSVLQLVDYLNKIIGKNIKPKFLPMRPGDVFRTLADISKAKELLGYKPEVNFEEGLRKTVEYFETQKLVKV